MEGDKSIRLPLLRLPWQLQLLQIEHNYPNTYEFESRPYQANPVISETFWTQFSRALLFLLGRFTILYNIWLFMAPQSTFEYLLIGSYVYHFVSLFRQSSKTILVSIDRNNIAYRLWIIAYEHFLLMYEHVLVSSVRFSLFSLYDDHDVIFIRWNVFPYLTCFVCMHVNSMLLFLSHCSDVNRGRERRFLVGELFSVFYSVLLFASSCKVESCFLRVRSSVRSLYRVWCSHFLARLKNEITVSIGLLISTPRFRSGLSSGWFSKLYFHQLYFCLDFTNSFGCLTQTA